MAFPSTRTCEVKPSQQDIPQSITMPLHTDYRHCIDEVFVPVPFSLSAPHSSACQECVERWLTGHITFLHMSLDQCLWFLHHWTLKCAFFFMMHVEFMSCNTTIISLFVLFLLTVWSCPGNNNAQSSAEQFSSILTYIWHLSISITKCMLWISGSIKLMAYP